MPKPSNLSLIILLSFLSLTHAQDASVVPPAKESVGSSRQQDGDATDQQEEFAKLFPVTVYGPHQKLEIDPADPPYAVAAQGRTCRLSSPNEWSSTTLVSGLLQMYSRSGRLLWTIPCRTTGYSSTRDQNAIAIDLARQRIYIREYDDYDSISKNRINGRTSAFDFHGNRIWSIIFDGYLVLEPTTGDLWISQIQLGSILTSGQTLIVDIDGKVIKSFLGDSSAMAYDRKTKSVWMQSRHTTGVDAKRKVSVLIDREDGSRWVCRARVAGEIARPWNTNIIEHYSAKGSWNSQKFLREDKIDRLEQGKPGKLIVHFRNTTEFFDKKNQTFEKFRDRCVASADESSIWIQDKDGVSAVDFDGKELFSVGIKGPQDWKVEMLKSEKFAGEIATKFPADDPRVRRSQQVVEDWKLFIKGMEFSQGKRPFGSESFDTLNLRLIRD